MPKPKTNKNQKCTKKSPQKKKFTMKKIAAMNTVTDQGIQRLCRSTEHTCLQLNTQKHHS